MFDYRIAFDSPIWLALLVILPAVWLLSFRSLAGLGTWRRIAAIGLRSLVLALLILAAAETQAVRVSDRMTVMYVVDQSQSIPEAERRAAIDYVNAAIRRQRSGDDRAGVVVFGREAAMETPPYDDNIQVPVPLESFFDPNQTNLAAAIKLAQASFPHDAAKRIVVISDGNENVGNAIEQAQAAAEAGIGFDVLPILYQPGGEVSVEKVTLPPNLRKGQAFDVRVVLNNSTPETAPNGGVVRGKLILSMRGDDQPVILSEQVIDLPPGKKVFTVRQEIEAPQFYTYEARFEPEDRSLDRMAQNNRATSFTQVRGSGQVLIVEGHENPGEHQALVEMLQRENLEVTLRDSQKMYTDINQLQQFDTVVLANVPREEFTDEQVKMLAINTQDMGAGLLMLGGPDSFGAGGWTNTPVEEAMPVDFQIKSAKVMPKGALVLMMHASEMAQGNHWQKRISRSAVEALGLEDYCGLLHYTGTGDAWLWGGLVPVSGRRDRMLRSIDQMVPGDMPDFEPSMKKALAAFQQRTDAAAKHMIIISDGDPGKPQASTVQALVRLKVTVSTVAVGTHGPAGHQTLQDLARTTAGTYYTVSNGAALPKIFQKEARRAARPLVFEDEKGFSPQMHTPGEILGITDQPFPPITGFVRTSLKQNPLVELNLSSPKPEGSSDPILASWTYGLGRSAVFTTDVGARWAKGWPEWSGFEKLTGTMIRWTMRPVTEEGKFTISTDVEDGKVKVFVTALDKNDEFLNFLDLKGGVVQPDMSSAPLKLTQTAPGRYVGTFDAKDVGSYLMTLSPGPGKAPLRAGINVPYSPEFSDRASNESLLLSLAALTPRYGAAGKVLRSESASATEPDDALDNLLKTDTFRHGLVKATSRQDIWQYLLYTAAILFLLDIFIRRVTISLAWLWPILARFRDRILGRDAPAPNVEMMARLRNRKEEISAQLEHQRAFTRFEPDPEQPAPDSKTLEEATSGDRSKESTRRPSGAPNLGPAAPEEEDFTSRLLKAKKKVWDDRDKPGQGGPSS